MVTTSENLTKKQLDGTKGKDAFKIESAYSTLITSSKGTDSIELEDLTINGTTEFSVVKSPNTGKMNALRIVWPGAAIGADPDAEVIVEDYFTLDKQGKITGTNSSIKTIVDKTSKKEYNLADIIKAADIFGEGITYAPDTKGVINGTAFNDVVKNTAASETFKLGTGKDEINFGTQEVSTGADIVNLDPNGSVNLAFNNANKVTYTTDKKDVIATFDTTWKVFQDAVTNDYYKAVTAANPADEEVKFYKDENGKLTMSPNCANSNLVGMYIQDGTEFVNSTTYTGTAAGSVYKNAEDALIESSVYKSYKTADGKYADLVSGTETDDPTGTYTTAYTGKYFENAAGDEFLKALPEGYIEADDTYFTYTKDSDTVIASTASEPVGYDKGEAVAVGTILKAKAGVTGQYETTTDYKVSSTTVYETPTGTLTNNATYDNIALNGVYDVVEDKLVLLEGVTVAEPKPGNGFYKDAEGNVYEHTIQNEAINHLAQRTDGTYVGGDILHVALEAGEDLAAYVVSDGGTGTKTVYKKFTKNTAASIAVDDYYVKNAETGVYTKYTEETGTFYQKGDVVSTTVGTGYVVSDNTYFTWTNKTDENDVVISADDLSETYNKSAEAVAVGTILKETAPSSGQYETTTDYTKLEKAYKDASDNYVATATKAEAAIDLNADSLAVSKNLPKGTCYVLGTVGDDSGVYHFEEYADCTFINLTETPYWDSIEEKITADANHSYTEWTDKVYYSEGQFYGAALESVDFAFKNTTTEALELNADWKVVSATNKLYQDKDSNYTASATSSNGEAIDLTTTTVYSHSTGTTTEYVTAVGTGYAVADGTYFTWTNKTDENDVVISADDLSGTYNKSAEAVAAGTILKEITGASGQYETSTDYVKVTEGTLYIDALSGAVTTSATYDNTAVADGTIYTETTTEGVTTYSPVTTHTVYEAAAGKTLYKVGTGVQELDTLKEFTFGDVTSSVTLKDYLTGKYDVTVNGDQIERTVKVADLVKADKKGVRTYKGTVIDTDIIGSEGVDKIYAAANKTTMEGGKGNDYLYGSTGKNTYVYNKATGAFGEDAIYAKGEYNNIDLTGLGALYSETSAPTGNYGYYFEKSGNDVVVNVVDTTTAANKEIGKIFVKDYLKGKAEVQITTNEGTEQLSTLINESYLMIDGSEGTKKQKLQGTQYDDLIMGGLNSDKLYGNGGNDTLFGGFGDDTITTGAGEDTIIFAHAISDKHIKDSSTDTLIRDNRYDSAQYLEFVGDLTDLDDYFGPQGAYRDVAFEFSTTGKNDVKVTATDNGQSVVIKDFNKVGNRADLFINGELLSSYTDDFDHNARYVLGDGTYGTQKDDTFKIGAGVDGVEYYGGNGKDVYEVGADSATTKFNLSTQTLVIADTGLDGKTDELSIWTTDKALTIFDVKLGATTETKVSGAEAGSALAIVSDQGTTNVLAANLNAGVSVSGIEAVTVNGTAASISDTIKGAVAGWLAGSSYGSAAEFFAKEENTANIANLIKVYAGQTGVDAYSAPMA